MHKQVVTYLGKTLRHSKCILHTDDEPAMRSLVNFVTLRTEREGRTAIAEVAPRYSSGSSGLAEALINKEQGQIRTLRLDTEHRYAMTIEVDSVAWPWLVKHANWLLARYEVHGVSGRTPFLQLNGCAYLGEMLPLAEAVLFSPCTLR